jgi:uncharacterized protein (TIGR03083 family)
MGIEEEIQKMNRSRSDLLALIDTLTPAELEAPRRIGEWSIKDVLGHITAWELACLNPLKAFILDRTWEVEDVHDHDAWNAVQVDKRRAWPLRQVFAELIEVREDLIDACLDFPPEEGEKLAVPWGEVTTLAGTLSGLAWHENEHIHHIKAALNRT